MVLRMKNILKIRLLGAGVGGEGGSWKTNIEGGLLKKGELGQLADLRGYGVGWYPNVHYGRLHKGYIINIVFMIFQDLAIFLIYFHILKII